MSTEPERSAPRWPVAVLGAAALAAVVLAIVYRGATFGFFGDVARVRAWVAQFGVGAPLAAILLGAALVVLAPIPNQFVGMANGYVFGVALGTLYSMLGLILGTLAAMAIARRLGRPWVERFVPKERLSRWDHVAGRWGPIVFFVAFVVPGLPDDLLCFVIGLSRLPLGPMLALVTFGRLPGMMGACWLGANAGELPSWVWPVAIAVGVVVSVLLFFFGDRVEQLSLALGRKLGRGGRS